MISTVDTRDGPAPAAAGFADTQAEPPTAAVTEAVDTDLSNLATKSDKR